MGKWTRFNLNEKEGDWFIGRTRNNEKEITDKLKIAGNYAIIINKKCIYIGESGNILKRLKSHIHMTIFSSNWKTRWGEYGKLTIAVRPESKNFERMMVESRLIDRLKPQYNKLNRNFEKWDANNGQ